MNALTIQGVRKSYAGLVAVDGLTLEARGGEILGLLGPNGAGKTTTVGLATGLLEPDEGRVDVEGLALRLGRYWYDMAGARA